MSMANHQPIPLMNWLVIYKLVLLLCFNTIDPASSQFIRLYISGNRYRQKPLHASVASRL